MKATLILKSKKIDPKGFILEMVIWALPTKTPDRPHAVKYRLYYGDNLGNCIVRYDNEQGKGDHKHIGETEEPYKFETPEKLIEDFFADIDRLTQKGGNYEKTYH